MNDLIYSKMAVTGDDNYTTVISYAFCHAYRII